MFGADGWCRSCGVPKHPQTGPFVLQRKGVTVVGAWVPNWQYDVICLEKSVADEVTSRFRLDVREVEWHPSSPGEAMHIVVPTIGEAWFNPDELREKAATHHPEMSTAGATCPDCGVWRWVPLVCGMLPPLRITPTLGDVDIAASPEWFGAGCQAFRQILLRRELAELIVTASPRDFKIHEVK